LHYRRLIDAGFGDGDITALSRQKQRHYFGQGLAAGGFP